MSARANAAALLVALTVVACRPSDAPREPVPHPTDTAFAIVATCGTRDTPPCRRAARAGVGAACDVEHECRPGLQCTRVTQPRRGRPRFVCKEPPPRPPLINTDPRKSSGPRPSLDATS